MFILLRAVRMTDQPVVLVETEAIASLGATLFPAYRTLWCNGSLPEGLGNAPGCVVVGSAPDRLATLCAALAASGCPSVRVWRVDLTGMTERQQILDAAEKTPILHYEPNPLPPAEAPMANPGLPRSVPEPAGADPNLTPHGPIGRENAAGGDPFGLLRGRAAPDPGSSPHEPPRDQDDDERAEVMRHEMRMSSNVVHLRKVELTEANAADWGEPSDQFEERPLPEWDYTWLPPAIEPFISDQSAIGGWDAGMMGLQAMVACAGCVSDQIMVRVRPRQDWFESARLWGLFYGGKSIKKTPALNTVLQHIRQINHRLSVEHIKAMAGYSRDMKVHDEQERVWVKKKAAGELGLLEPIPPAKPVDYQLVFEDFTTAALSDVLSTGNERGGIGAMDELAALWERLDSFSQGRGTERQDVLRLYNGGAHTINRVGRGKVAVDNWSLSIIGGIQDEVLGRIVSKLDLTSDGMVQRFMPYWTQRATMGEERPADEAAKRHWERTIDCLYALRPHLEPVRFSPDAQLLRVQADVWVHETGEEFGLPLSIVPFLDKFYGTFPRLCLTFWAIECAGEGRQVIGPEIPLTTCERAWRYLQDCIWPHAMKLYSEALTAERASGNGLRQICTWIVCREEGAGSGITLRDVAQNCKEAWYPPAPESVINQRRAGMINDLITHAWLRAANAPDRIGKLPTQYHVNPRVYERFADIRAEQGPKRRAAYAAMEARKAAKRRQAGED